MSRIKQEHRRQTIQEVFENSSLKKSGYKYLKSKGLISKKVGDLDYSIGFSSSARSNALENINIIIVNVGVENLEFGKWQQNQLNKYPSGLIASSKIKNIFKSGPPYYDFDIQENEDTRQKIVKELIELVENNAYKFFDICSDIELIFKYIELECFNLGSIIEYLAYLKQTTRIETLIEQKNKKHPELRSQIKKYYDNFDQGTLNQEVRKETYKDESKRTAIVMAESLWNIKYW